MKKIKLPTASSCELTKPKTDKTPNARIKQLSTCGKHRVSCPIRCSPVDAPLILFSRYKNNPLTVGSPKRITAIVMEGQTRHGFASSAKMVLSS
jgi:hypothetical protein